MSQIATLRPLDSDAEERPQPFSSHAAPTRRMSERLAGKLAQVGCFMAADVLAMAAAFLTAHLLRVNVIPVDQPFPLAAYQRVWWMVLVYVVFYIKEGLYVRRRPFWVELGHVYLAIVMATGFSLGILTLSRASTQVSRLTLGLAVGLLFIYAPLARYAVKSTLNRFGLWGKRILILGATRTGELLARNLAKDPYLGYQVAGFLDDDVNRHGTTCADVPVLGGIRDLPTCLKATTSSDVLLAFDVLTREQLQDILDVCERHTESIRLVPDVLGFGLAGSEVEIVSQVPVISMNFNLRKPWNSVLKSVFDRFLSLIFLCFAAPVIAIISVLVKLETGAPIFFVQRRVGPGYGFDCIKFRTMHVDGDERLRRYLEEHPERRPEWNEFRKLKGYDPRVTRVGAFLRSTSLDELPQLWNIVKGEMSLVGPRPYMPSEIEQMGDHPERILNTILVTRPGLTGLWQVSGRSDVPFEDRIRLDVHYVRNWSLWLDLVILCKTVWVVLARKGAY